MESRPTAAAHTLFMLSVGGGTVRFRAGTGADIAAIVRLVAEDPLAAKREDLRSMAPYEAAFEAIDSDPAQLLVVGELEAENGGIPEVVATFQLSFIPGLSRMGSLRAQIEAVRVARAVRNRGVGEAMLRWALEESRRRGCALIQLTTDKSRFEAHRFYERLGFAATHTGMKLSLV